MTSIYLAGPYAARDRIKAFAAELDSMLIDVTSSWLKETVAITPGVTGAATAIDDATIASHARADLDDIANSDLVVLVTAAVAGVEGTSGGRHVETGYALGLGLPVLVVGAPENVFHRLGETSGVQVASDWPDAVRLIVEATL